MKTCSVLLLIVFSISPVLAQDFDFNPKTEIRKGILGNYTVQESWDWWDQNVGNNFFRDEINIQLNESDIRKVKSDVGRINEYMVDMTDIVAVFYVCPESSDTIKLSGYMEYDDGWVAAMYIIVPQDILPTLKTLPPTTLVFAIAESSIVWGILKFFEDVEYSQFNIDGEEMITFRYDSGKIVYEYRPTPEEVEWIGTEAYFTPPSRRRAMLISYKKDKQTVRNCASDNVYSGPVKSIKETSYEATESFGKTLKGEKMIEVNYSFDKMGNLIEESRTSKDVNSKTLYKYNSFGTFIEGQVKDRNNGKVLADIKSDEDGNCVRITYDKERTIKSFTKFDDEGNKVSKIYIDEELFSTSTFTYDEYGNVKKTSISVPSLPQVQKEGSFETRYIYDDDGRILEEEGILKVYYKYDERNYDNWIISKTYQSGKLQMITEREIEYY